MIQKRTLKSCANAYFISNPPPYGIGVVCSKRALPEITGREIQAGKRNVCGVCRFCPDYKVKDVKNGLD